MMRTIFAFAVAALAGYVVAVGAYTERIIAAQRSFGGGYTQAQIVETAFANLTGLWLFGVIIGIGFAIAFTVAGLVRKVAPIPGAFVVAGGVSMLVAITLIEQMLGGGAGLIGGARTLSGMAMQFAAGAVAGAVFSLLRARR